MKISTQDYKNMIRKPVIAIDGYSSTGKSSISKSIAQRLGLIHLDTGALYRGITYFALQNFKEKDLINKELLFKQFSNIVLEFRTIDDTLVLFLNGNDISKEIRLPEVSAYVSFIAKQQEVRTFLLEIQRNIAKNGGIIVDGRDIGTTVLPNADYKFFLIASIEERTKRRHQELLSMGENISSDEVKENLLSRDKIDSEREVSPLRKAEDAILIDNSNVTKEETVDLILSYIK